MDTCGFYRLLHTALPFLFILSFGRAIAQRGFAWVVLAGITTYQVSLFLLTMVLGHLEVLRALPFRIGFLSLSIVTAWFSVRALPALGRAVVSMRYKPRWGDPLIGAAGVLSALSFYFQWVNDWSMGPSHFDSVGYHITRALLWFDQGNFDAWRTANWHHIGLPLGGDAELQPTIFLGCGWLGAASVGMVDTIGAAVALYMIQVAYGISVRGALLGALAFVSFPTVGLRINEINTDMAAAFPVLAGVALFLNSRSLSRGVCVYLALIGLGMAAKAYVLFAAIPISIVLFVPRLRELWRTPGIVRSVLGGVAVAVVFFLLSYEPVYAAFGSFYGGESGQRLSSYGRPLREIVLTTLAHSLTWTMEPLMVVPNDNREAVFGFLNLQELYGWFELSPRWFPQLHSGENRTGIFPLILLPWLIMAVKRGYRTLVFVLFVALFCSVTSPMSLNLGAARFALLSSALFAVLWGARGARNPILVGLFVLASSWVSFDYLKRHGIAKWIPHYTEEIEPYRKVAEVMAGEPLLIFSRGLATEAFASGRHGRWRFAYIDCPPQGMTYRDWLVSLKQRSHWIGVELDAPASRFGPLFTSNLGPVCPEITRERLREELESAGWRYYANVSYAEQVWRAEY
ncbi:MAG: hypothetical protein RL518_2808 [Pseudomonadota bacterium]|jgi:hypothetical protein